LPFSTAFHGRSSLTNPNPVAIINEGWGGK
jgi:hypothetical protein